MPPPFVPQTVLQTVFPALPALLFHDSPDERLAGAGLAGYGAGLQIPPSRLLCPGLLVGMEHGKGFPRPDIISHLSAQHQPYGQIDPPLLRLSASPQNQGADPHLITDDPAYVTVSGGRYGTDDLCLGQQLRVIYRGGVPVLSLHELRQLS